MSNNSNQNLGNGLMNPGPIEKLLLEGLERGIGEHDMVRCRFCGREGHNGMIGDRYGIKHADKCVWLDAALAQARTQPETAKCGHRFMARGDRKLGIPDRLLEPPCDLPVTHEGQHRAGNTTWGEGAAQTDGGLREALERSVVALDDWLHIHASDHCDEARVAEAHKRVKARGTIAYIAEVQEANRAALAATLASESEQRPYCTHGEAYRMVDIYHHNGACMRKE